MGREEEEGREGEEGEGREGEEREREAGEGRGERCQGEEMTGGKGEQ